MTGAPAMRDLVSRRGFLSLSGAFAAAILLPQPRPAAAATLRQSFATATANGGVIDIDLATGRIRHLKLNFKPHSLVQNPRHPARIIAVEKWGRSLAVIDYDTWTQIQRINCPLGCFFQGHADFLAAGASFVTTVVQNLSGTGHLITWDALSCTPISQVRVSPGGLHQCAVSQNNWVDIASTGIEPVHGLTPDTGNEIANSAICRIEANSGILVEQTTLPDSRQSITHFARDVSGTTIAITTPRLLPQNRSGAIYIEDRSGQYQKVDLPGSAAEHLCGEMLSLAINDRAGVAAITNTASPHVFLIDIGTRALITTIKVWSPGIAYDPNRNQFIAAAETLIAIDPGGKVSPLPLAGLDLLPDLAETHATLLSRSLL